MVSKTLAGRAHEQLHKLPGMPEHGEAARLNHRGGLPNRPLASRPLPSRRRGRGHKEPRVLIGWQNAVARWFSREGR